MTLPKHRTPQGALACLALCVTLASLGTSIANVALPELARFFSVSVQGAQWIVLAYLLPLTVLVVNAGKIGDLLGRRKVLLFGLALFVFASLLCGFTPWYWALLLSRGAQGIGAAVLMALTLAVIRDIVPREKMGGAMGLIGTMSAIGTALGPSLGGFLVSVWGWRSLFFVLSPLGLLVLVLAYFYLPKDHEREKSSPAFDGLGTLFLAFTLLCYSLAMTVNRTAFGTENIAMLLLGVLALGLFIRIENKASFPLLKPELFADKQFVFNLLSNTVVASVMMSTLVVGPFYLSISLGLDEKDIGLVMASGPVMASISGVPAGMAVNRWGVKHTMLAGLGLMLLGSLSIIYFPDLFGPTGYVMALALLTPGYQMFQAANNTAVMMDTHTDQRGLIAAMLTLFRNVGLITGASVMGGIFAFSAGSAPLESLGPEAVSMGMGITFIVASSLVFICLLVAVFGIDQAIGTEALRTNKIKSNA
ncbi:MFS transporter (plasmid) [Fulvitalea axinellae]|uniref:MFS transporter n=1 Tax=Fulvitalea axinellae TaxID=1182444 RepID=A0AAU9CQT1_9BACT|nr:MFS transporter [Fulvitalea axinellae]